MFQLELKLSSKYPRKVQSRSNELDVLLTFMNYPSSIRNVIYTTNASNDQGVSETFNVDEQY